MTDVEERLVNVEKRQDSFETFVRVYIQKIDERMARQEEDLKEHKAEMRAFQAKHDADMKRIDEKFDKIDEKFDKIDEKFDRLESKIDGMTKFIQSLTVTAIIGVGASVAAAIAIAYTAINALAKGV